MTEASVSFAGDLTDDPAPAPERVIARAMFRVVCGRREPEASF